jgi:hypothetical protein
MSASGLNRVVWRRRDAPVKTRLATTDQLPSAVDGFGPIATAKLGITVRVTLRFHVHPAAR